MDIGAFFKEIPERFEYLWSSLDFVQKQECFPGFDDRVLL